MSEVLNKDEIKELARLGKEIQAELSCDINDQGIPCRTGRFAVIEMMKDYLKIHNYEILEIY